MVIYHITLIKIKREKIIIPREFSLSVNYIYALVEVNERSCRTRFDGICGSSQSLAINRPPSNSRKLLRFSESDE